jgi:hypothetical protein
MVRELLDKVIRTKRSLYSDLAAIEDEKATICARHFSSSTETEAEFERNLLNADEKESKKNITLLRTNKFGMSFSKGDTPAICFTCYVTHDKESPMVEVGSPDINGVRKFKCTTCGEELRMERPLGRP